MTDDTPAADSTAELPWPIELLRTASLGELIGALGAAAVAASMGYVWGYSWAIRVDLFRYFAVSDYAATAVTWVPTLAVVVVLATPVALTLIVLSSRLQARPSKLVSRSLYGFVVIATLGLFIFALQIGERTTTLFAFWFLITTVIIFGADPLTKSFSKPTRALVGLAIVVAATGSGSFLLGLAQAESPSRPWASIQFVDGHQKTGVIHFSLNRYLLFTPANSDSLLVIPQREIARQVHPHANIPAPVIGQFRSETDSLGQVIDSLDAETSRLTRIRGHQKSFAALLRPVYDSQSVALAVVRSLTEETERANREIERESELLSSLVEQLGKDSASKTARYRQSAARAVGLVRSQDRRRGTQDSIFAEIDRRRSWIDSLKREYDRLRAEEQ